MHGAIDNWPRDRPIVTLRSCPEDTGAVRGDAGQTRHSAIAPRQGRWRQARRTAVADRAKAWITAFPLALLFADGDFPGQWQQSVFEIGVLL
jgi:hypothetical protein